MVRFLLPLALVTALGCSSETVAKEQTPSQPAYSPSSTEVTGSVYRARYPLRNASEKLVNNRAEGPENLYGTRNFRAVLHGVYYRGGGANAFLKPKPRNNANPLPDIGLENLCQEGFTRSVYLYSTNYQTAPKEVRCRTFEGNENKLSYLQISPLAYRASDQRALLTMILEHVRDPRLGPIYDHCWNGWHASGFVAALTLRQFCDFTIEEAIDYWNLNTDGNNKGAGYDRVRENIRKFVPYQDLSLTKEEKSVLCPRPGDLKFR